MARIVVGVDGSDSSRAALAWAVEEATLRDADLEVVCAFQAPVGWFGLGGVMGTATMAVAPSDDEVARYARQTADEAVQTVCAGHKDVTVRTLAAPGHPADVLVDRAADADLLVVGSRGHGDFGSVLLGSTGMHCVHHAPCPVVVVHGPKAP